MLIKQFRFGYFKELFLINKRKKKDKVTILANIAATRDVQSELIANQRLPEEQLKKVLQLKDLLDKVLGIDASKRISIKQAMLHPFVDDKN